MSKGGSRRRATFAATDQERRAICEAEIFWRKNIADAPQVDKEKLNALRAACALINQALDDFWRHASMRASVLSRMQDLEGYRHAQAHYCGQLENAFEVLLLLERAASDLAPNRGVKANGLQRAFVVCAADHWHRYVGRKPSATGRFFQAIQQCAQASQLKGITEDRVKGALAVFKRGN